MAKVARRPPRNAKERHQAAVEERRHRRLRYVIAILVVAIVAEAAWIAVRSDWFDLRGIEVTGNHQVPSARIMKLSRLTRKTNILSVRPELAAVRVKREPWVKEAEVVRRFPQLTVDIRVEERRPHAVLLVGKTYYLLDEDAVVLGRAGRNTFNLPLV